MTDPKRQNKNDSQEWIETWEAMAKIAGYSSRTLEKREKDDPNFPTVERMDHGQKKRVRVKREALERWATNYPNEKNKPTQPEVTVAPVAERRKSSWHRFVFWVSVLVTVILGFIFWPSKHMKNRATAVKKPDIYKATFRAPRMPANNSVVLLDEQGDVIREVWNSRNLKHPLSNHDYHFLEKKFAFRPNIAGYRAAMLTILANKSPVIHTYEGSKPLALPDLEYVKSRGLTSMAPFTNFRFVDRIQQPSFSGWVVNVNSKHQFSGVLCFYDEDFKLMATLFNPGNIFSGFASGDHYFFSAGYNARMKENQFWRAALGKISLKRLLARETPVQLMPFSKKTLPLAERFNEYFLADIPTMAPDEYVIWTLHGKEGCKATIRLKKDPTEFVFYYKIGAFDEMLFHFDLNLNLSHKHIKEHKWPDDSDPETYLANIGFRYWQQDNWGPWVYSKKYRHTP